VDSALLALFLTLFGVQVTLDIIPQLVSVVRLVLTARTCLDLHEVAGEFASVITKAVATGAMGFIGCKAFEGAKAAAKHIKGKFNTGGSCPAPNPKTGSTGDFENFVTPNKGIIGNLDGNGYVEFKINTEGSGVRGTDLFKQMIEHFGCNAKGIWGKWRKGTNLDKVNELTRSGVSLEEAVKQTWTANRAREAGFGVATVKKSVGSAGAYTDVEVLFTPN
jgi:hypothetical protein